MLIGVETDFIHGENRCDNGDPPPPLPNSDCWPSHEEDQSDSKSSQTNDLPNLYLSLPILVLDIIRIGQGMVSSRLCD